MGNWEPSCEFDKAQIVMARWLGQNISKTAGVFPLCSGYYLSKVVQGGNTGEPVTGSWAAKVRCGKWKLARVFRFNRPATVDEIAKKCDAERCQNTQCIVVCCIWSVGGQRAHEHQNGITEQWKKVAGLMNHIVFYITSWVRCLPGEHMEPGCTVERRQAGKVSVML